MLNEIITNIEGQINNCKKLLTIFQDERKTYLEKASIGQKDIEEILGRKKMLVDIFEKQRSTMMKIQAENQAAAIPDNVKEKRKGLVRELAALLEQLLVIDQENEKMLRNILTSRSSSAQASSGGQMKQRPSLQRQLPFVPAAAQQAPMPLMSRGMPSQPSRVNINTVGEHAVTEAAEIKSAAFNAPRAPMAAPRSIVRHYAEAGKLMQLTSKYA